MRLIYSDTKTEVSSGDIVRAKNGQIFEVMSITKPHHPGSTGRVHVKEADNGWSQGFFPSVIGAEWVDREDRE